MTVYGKSCGMHDYYFRNWVLQHITPFACISALLTDRTAKKSTGHSQFDSNPLES